MPCAICSEPLDGQEQRSLEHVILNALGGRKKLPDVLCAACNSRSGEEWDSVLAAQLNWLCLLLGISRDRGVSPPERVKTVGGEQYTLYHHGSLTPVQPSYSATPMPDGRVQIQIMARTNAEARRMLTGAKGKYPNLDVDALLREIKVESSYPTSPFHFQPQFGGPLAGRSLVKSVLCLAVSAGVDAAHCNAARQYLRDPQAEACFGYFYERDLLIDRPARVPLHFIGVSSKGTEGELLGYIELFTAQRCLVRLAGNYDGPEVHCSHAIDPTTGTTLELNFALNLGRDVVNDCLAGKESPARAVEEAFSMPLAVAHQRSSERVRDRVISEAVHYAFEHCGAKEGEVLTDEHISRLSALMTEKMMPYILPRLVRDRPLPAFDPESDDAQQDSGTS